MLLQKLTANVQQQQDNVQMNLTWELVPVEQVNRDLRTIALELHERTQRVVYATEPRPLSNGWAATVRIEDRSPEYFDVMRSVAQNVNYIAKVG